jgi:hypothetical protein
MEMVIEVDDVISCSGLQLGNSLIDFCKIQSTCGPDMLVVMFVQRVYTPSCTKMMLLKQVLTSSELKEVYPQDWRYAAVM